MARRLEEFVQLHQSVEIIYVVDGYSAQYNVYDSNMLEREAGGATIQEALENLLASLVANPPEAGGPRALYCPKCKKLLQTHGETCEKRTRDKGFGLHYGSGGSGT